MLVEKRSSIISLTLLVLAAQRCHCFDVSLMLEVAAGGRECFHQDISHGTQYEIEYNVVGGGELDINFMMQTPSGNSVFYGERKTQDAHRAQAMETGEYVFCFDNTFSHIAVKTIFFGLVVHEDPSEATSGDPQQGNSESPELRLYDITLESFKKSTDSIKDRLEKSIQLQRVFSGVELRDRSIQEYNFERVNFWSPLQLFVMLSVGLVNVLMIRGLFDDKRRKVKTADVKLRT